MDNPLYYVGIDIAKEKFDVAINFPSPQHRIFNNNPKGFQAFTQWLNKFNAPFHCLMEATNIYHEDLADFLLEKGFSVSVINPKYTPNFAKSLNLRSKTDKIDAKMLLAFAQAYADRLPQYQPPPPAQRELLRKLRQLEHFKSLAQQEKVRVTMLKDNEAISLSNDLICYLKQQVMQLEKAILRLIKNNAMLHHNFKLLRTIPAIGVQSACQLLAYLSDGSRFKNGKAAATFAGVTPMVRQSGKSLNQRPGISKIGQADIRKALFMPAMAFCFGSHKQCVYAPFVQRLLRHGKAKKAIIVALIRKLITIAQSVLAHQKPFDEAIFLQKN